jgi:hypothetical protein
LKADSQATINDRWYLFKAPDEDFSVVFPAKSRHEPDHEALSGSMYYYAFDTESSTGDSATV